jgi:protease stability complex PrcB-like protein
MRCAASLLVLLASCAACAAVGVAVPFSTLAKGLNSGVREPAQVVIRNRDDWVAFWERHTRTQAESPSAPPVDFSADMVVALFMGERGAAGHAIEITRVERTDSSLAIHYRTRGPDPGAMLAQVLTQPFHAIRLPRVDGPVMFVESPSR